MGSPRAAGALEEAPLDAAPPRSRQGRAGIGIAQFVQAISAAGRRQLWQEGLSTLDGVANVGIQPDVIAWTATMSCSTRGKAWIHAVQALEEVWRASVRLDGATVLAGSAACAGSLLWQCSLSLPQQLRGIKAEEGYVRMGVAAAITSLEKAKQWEAARQLFGGLLDSGALPDLVVHNAAVSACRLGQQWRQPLALVHAARLRRVAANAVTCTAAVTAAQRAVQWACAARWLTAARAETLEPNLYMCNAAVGALSSGQQWAQALGGLADVKRSSVGLDAIAGKAALQACDAALAWQRAGELLRTLAATSLELAVAAMGSTLPSVGADWPRGLQLLEHSALKAAGVPPGARGACAAALGQAAPACWPSMCELLLRSRTAESPLRPFDCNVLLSALVQSQQWACASALLLQEMRRMSTEPDIITCSSGLAALGTARAWQAVVALLSSCRTDALQSDAVATNAAIAACRGAGPWDLAGGLLEAARRDGVRANAATLTAAAGGGGGAAAEGGPNGAAQLWRRALHSLRAARGSSSEPGLIAYNAAAAAAAAAAGEGQGWPGACELLLELEDRGIGIDAVSLNIAVSGTEKGHRWTSAVNLLRTAARAGVERQADAFNACVSAAEKGNQWAQVSVALRAMRQALAECDVITYSAATSAMQKGQQWEKALGGVLQEMCRRSVEPNLVARNAAISALERGLQWELALEVLEEVVALRLRPNAFTYSAAISACEKGRQWVLALALLRRMEEERVELSVITYSAAISAFEKGLQWQGAAMLWQEMQQASVEQNSISFNAAITSAEASGWWQRAMELLQEMADRVVEVNVITYNAAMSVCEKSQQWARVLALLCDMLARELVADVVSYNVACLACLHAEQWQLAFSLVEEMAARGIQPDMTSYRRLLMESEQRRLVDYEVAFLLGLGRGAAETAGAGADAVLAAAAANAAALRLATAGRRAQAEGLLKEHMPGSAAAAASAPVLAALSRGSATPLAALPVQRAATASASARAAPVKSRYAKELALLQHVLCTAQPGDGASVCAAAESFGTDVLPASQMWLKIAGREKADTLAAAARSAPPGVVLEIGSYCGYSSSRLGLALPNVRIITLEVDPVHVVIARNVLAVAGLAAAVDVWTGHSGELVPRLAQHARGAGFQVSAAFMDQRGSLFEEDLATAERLGLLRPGAVVIADNVLKPGAPLFLWRVVRASAYRTQIVRVVEFAMPADDWMSVTVCMPGSSRPRGAPPPLASSERDTGAAADEPAPLLEPPPADLRALEAEADRMREKAMNPSRSVTFGEWASFAQRARRRLAEWGIVETAHALPH